MDPVALSTPTADIVTDCFPVAQKFQSLSYGPAVALSGSEWLRISSLGPVERNNYGTPKRHAGKHKTDPSCKALVDVLASHVRSSAAQYLRPANHSAIERNCHGPRNRQVVEGG